MILNNSTRALHPDLLRVYLAALPIYKQRHPQGPSISLNETSRSEPIQTAYYMQGRVNLAPLNALRKKAGLWAIGLAEARNRVSNARYGESSHNFELSRAFDLRAERKGVYLGDRAAYEPFWLICKEVAKALGIAITWGGNWKDWPHIELTNWRTMS